MFATTDLATAYRLLIADVYELAGVSRETSEAIAARFGLTAARWHVLSVVWDTPAPVPAIARRLGLARQSVQRVVDDLERQGHVELRPNPAHRRSPLVALTEAGRAALDAVTEASSAERGALVARAGLSADDLLAARTTLRALLAAYPRDGERGEVDDDRSVPRRPV